MSQQVKTTSVKVNPETWKRIKISAIERDKEVQEVVEEALTLYLKH